MTVVTRDIRRSLKIIENKNSDFISPAFGWGYLYNCSYCNIKTNKPRGLSISKNINQILVEITNHAVFVKRSKPIVYDIGYNEDFAHNLENHEWKRIFDFFKHNDKLIATFSTRTVNKNLLKYNPQQKIRIKINLIPESRRKIHEPETSTIQERVEAINELKEAGYEIYLFFNPIIVYDEWLDDYEELFSLINNHVKDTNNIFSECMFLIHDERRHYRNMLKHPDTELDLWYPDIQEQYNNKIEYSKKLKKEFIKVFIKEHNNIIPWSKIKYIL